MHYHQIIQLKNGKECCLRSGTEQDGPAALALFLLTHGETDYLFTYPDENTFDAAAESKFLKEKLERDNELELLALVDGQVVGTAGIEAIGSQYKVRHRAEFGISIAKAFWGLGIGRAMMDACIQCAKQMGYRQLELTVVAENTLAVSIYKRAGFVEYGRNPKGFSSRFTGDQELVYMRLEL